ncbi:MAG: thioredoxin family protein [Chloroflexi bacterium]|nr:thioredoxin family protein [Chloroflexota bacterium]BCY19195.1 hypothetical protein hrd7_30440 [Leptolinea sp. HRD-7]
MKQLKKELEQDHLILLISGTCCYPQLALKDKQAEEIILQAITETGIKAEFRKINVSAALMGVIPLEILRVTGLTTDLSKIMRLPAILINNKFISLGIPRLEDIKAALQNSI